MESFVKLFKVPEPALSVLGRIVEPEESALLETLGEALFDEEQARSAYELANRPLPRDGMAAFLDRAYRRGILSLEASTSSEPTRYKAADFYGRLDIFAVSETEAYLSLPLEARRELEAWYLGTYIERLGEVEFPSADRVLLLDEAIALVKAEKRPIYLGRCDCRILAGNCGRPRETCISFRSGLNSLADRGWSRRISGEEAAEVLRMADAAGLMHTANPNGVCNCCGDCCYLFRARSARRERLGQRGEAWPAMAYVAAVDGPSCVGCGSCAVRCHFGAIALEGGGAAIDRSRCVGCGLCSTACPAGAISMGPRTSDVRRLR